MTEEQLLIKIRDAAQQALERPELREVKAAQIKALALRLQNTVSWNQIHVAPGVRIVDEDDGYND